ncbi:translation elongation factor Ts [Actinomadura coerulea]|uniref:translation elongation factor Ts n=1 Tax=Actinomadura coerulea TaxID=46159 RepID=UPI0034480C3E
MANFTAADVKRLRDLTGSGMMAVKNALTEADGDFEKATELLRLKGAKDVGKRAERTAANGLVAEHFADSGDGALLELNCETDFVAKNEQFIELAQRLVEFAAASGVTDAAGLLTTEIEPGKTVQVLIEENSAKIGEKLELRRFAHFQGAFVASYLHKSDPSLPPTTGVLVELDSENAEVAKDVAQQIAAMAPKYLTREEIPAEAIEKERALAEQLTRDEGKPEQAIPKIVEGRVNAYFRDFVLVEQAFVKDNKKTIAKVLDEAGVKVVRFARFKVGQA